MSKNEMAAWRENRKIVMKGEENNMNSGVKSSK